ncbi:MAG: FkbM family methyltransferase [Proteobacteria bacterium]|nr:FkbM family methyltransferase [Pseudomonadota bacterium]
MALDRVPGIGEKQPMDSDILISDAAPAQPFQVQELPVIAILARAAHRTYQSRWQKRLCKRPARLIYDFAHDVFKLGGTGKLTVAMPDGKKNARFDARKAHFGSLYFDRAPAGYEPDVAAVLAALLTGPRTFLDIGANWGYFTLYAAALRGFTGPIHAFEPAPATRADLNGLVAELALASRVTVHAEALSDHHGQAEMAIHEAETGLNRIAGSGLGREGAGRASVALARLDDLGLSPDVIKMDVEDHEFEALSGGRAVLAEAKPAIIVESWLTPPKPVRTLQALRLLDDLGYRLYQPCWQVRTADGPVIFPDIGDRLPGPDCRLALVPFQPEQRFMLRQQMNVVALHKDRLKQLIGFQFSRADIA